jgi:hypothetical protein
MAIRLLASSLVLAPIAILVIAMPACGGSGDDSSLFPTAQPDAAPLVPPYDGGSLIPGTDAGGDAAAECTPAPLGSFKATWRKPTTSMAAKCSSAQFQSFYDDCLNAPLTSPACTAFVAANGDCSTCLQSEDTDSQYAAIIWHSNHAFWTLNTAGCIANLQDDTSSSGCGAAYQGAIQCEETACTACGVADYALFPQCEQSSSSECNAYLEAKSAACGTELKDANDPASVCTSAATAADAYLIIAPVFCGSPTSGGGDGGM